LLTGTLQLINWLKTCEEPHNKVKMGVKFILR
jgi:hypothetical protein